MLNLNESMLKHCLSEEPMAVEIVDNKKKVHKTTTVLLSVFLFVLSVLEIVQPYIDVLAPVIPPGTFPFIAAGFGIAIGIGRYIKQDLDDGSFDGRAGEKQHDCEP